MVVGVAALFLAGYGLAAPTAPQRAEILAIGTLLTKAGNLYKESKFKDAGEVIKEIQTRLAKVAEGADQQTIEQLLPMHKRLVNAHALLELEGIKLPELKPLETPKPAATTTGKTAPAKTATDKTTAKTKAKARGKASLEPVSFVKEVAPILSTHCGTCHVRNARGMFSMSTFDGLMKGPMSAGAVIKPGDSENSLLLQKIADKEMPPSGAGIPAADLETLTKWVQGGAKFDGPSPTAQLTTYVTASAAATPAAAKVQMATGSETLSFAREVAAVLAEKCTGCHGTQNPRNNFNLTTITTLMRGGDRGEPILPGNAADSLLIKKLKGTADGARMPQRGGPLDDATIAKIEKWISEGAKFDGPNPAQPLREVAAIAKAQSSTHEQLSADRANLANENWRLGMPGATANKAESTNFLVLGNVGEHSLKDIAARAEALAPKVADVFKAPRDQALVKGRVTLFVFGDKYDYGEFGKMVEKRDLPTEWRGHYKFSIVDAYGAVLAPKATEYSLDALIAQELGAVYIASLGKGVPHWFAEGCGRVVASRLAPNGDRRVSAWDDELSSVLGTMAAPDDFLAGKLQPEQSDIASYSFVRFLSADRRFGNLIDGLRKGGEFKPTVSATFGATPEELAKQWVRNPPRARARSGK